MLGSFRETSNGSTFGMFKLPEQSATQTPNNTHSNNHESQDKRDPVKR